MNNEKILITGGCGFVGSNLAIGLRRDYPKAEIMVMDNLQRKGSELNVLRMKQNSIIFIQGDVRKKNDFDLIGEISILIDAAADPSVLAGIHDTPDQVIETNLMGTINCLNFARKNKAKFVFLSTSRVYPIAQLNEINYQELEKRFSISESQILKGVTAKGIDESFSLNGARSFYGTSKLSSEHFIAEYNEFYGLKSIINRCGVITGPWQMGKVDQGVIVLWMAKHFWKGELNYIGFEGSGKQVRDLLHIDDLYQLIKTQLNDFLNYEGQTFNVGGGQEVSVSLMELTELCEEITGNKIKINAVKEMRQADIPIYITDNTKISNLSGWRPQKTVRDTLVDIYQWLQSESDELKKFLN